MQKDHEAYCQMVNIMFCWATILQKSSAKQFPAALGIIQMHISPVVWKTETVTVKKIINK